jgi:hypothetical protein
VSFSQKTVKHPGSSYGANVAKCLAIGWTVSLNLRELYSTVLRVCKNGVANVTYREKRAYPEECFWPRMANSSLRVTFHVIAVPIKESGNEKLWP